MWCHVEEVVEMRRLVSYAAVALILSATTVSHDGFAQKNGKVAKSVPAPAPLPPSPPTKAEEAPFKKVKICCDAPPPPPPPPPDPNVPQLH